MILERIAMAGIQGNKRVCFENSKRPDTVLKPQSKTHFEIFLDTTEENAKNQCGLLYYFRRPIVHTHFDQMKKNYNYYIDYGARKSNNKKKTKNVIDPRLQKSLEMAKENLPREAYKKVKISYMLTKVARDVTFLSLSGVEKLEIEIKNFDKKRRMPKLFLDGIHSIVADQKDRLQHIDNDSNMTHDISPSTDRVLRMLRSCTVRRVGRLPTSQMKT